MKRENDLRNYNNGAHNSRHERDAHKGQRWQTWTAHKTGQPLGGLGAWLSYQERQVGRSHV